ncbi:MAG: hypothetical protein JNM27_15510 [Leptospirales bacterium]|nr:hypothetical protein [Leptospirales bacterium]
MKEIESTLEQLKGLQRDLSSSLRRHALTIPSAGALEKAITRVQADVEKKILERRLEKITPVIKTRSAEYLKSIFKTQGWRFPAVSKWDAAGRKKAGAAIPVNVDADGLARILEEADRQRVFDFSRMSLDQIRVTITRENDLTTLWEKLPAAYRPKSKPKTVAQLQEKAYALAAQGREASGFHE